jgi:hypothetical protein
VKYPFYPSTGASAASNLPIQYIFGTGSQTKPPKIPTIPRRPLSLPYRLSLPPSLSISAPADWGKMRWNRWIYADFGGLEWSQVKFDAHEMSEKARKRERPLLYERTVRQTGTTGTARCKREIFHPTWPLLALVRGEAKLYQSLLSTLDVLSRPTPSSQLPTPNSHLLPNTPIFHTYFSTRAHLTSTVST